MTDIFNHEAENKKINDEERKLRSREVGDIKKILELPQGRRVIWKILTDCHIFNISFNLNTKQEDFREGERNIGLKVLDRVNEADVNAFAQMQAEYVSEQKSKEAIKQKEKEKEENGEA